VLTSSDIFSEVLQDVGGQTAPAALPLSAAARAMGTEEAVEKRLRDTLSGILNPRSAPRTEATPPPAGPARFSTDTEIEKMISDTLSGIKLQARAKTGTH